MRLLANTLLANIDVRCPVLRCWPGSKQFVNNPNSHIAPALAACQLLLFFIGKDRSGKMKCHRECGLLFIYFFHFFF